MNRPFCGKNLDYQIKQKVINDDNAKNKGITRVFRKSRNYVHTSYMLASARTYETLHTLVTQTLQISLNSVRVGGSYVWAYGILSESKSGLVEPESTHE